MFAESYRSLVAVRGDMADGEEHAARPLDRFERAH